MAETKSVYSLLKEIYLIIDDGDRNLLSNFNLTPSRYYALVHIGRDPGMSLSELSALMLCDKSNATRIIKGLEAEGLVTKKPHETDGRTIRLYLSESGIALREKALDAHRSYNRNRFAKVAGVEQDHLVNRLVQLKSTLHQDLRMGSTT